MEIKRTNKYKDLYKSSVNYKNFEPDETRLEYIDWLKKYKEFDMYFIPEIIVIKNESVKDYIDYINLTEPDKNKHVEVQAIDIDDILKDTTTHYHHCSYLNWLDRPDVINKITSMNSQIKEVIKADQDSRCPVKKTIHNPEITRRRRKPIVDDTELL